MDGIESIGLVAGGLAIGADTMRRMVHLRVATILSSILFIVYGIMIGSLPIVAMELVLLPINAFRLGELLLAKRLTDGSQKSGNNQFLAARSAQR